MEIPSGLMFSGGDTLGTASKMMYTRPITKIIRPEKTRNQLAPLMLAPINV